MNKSTEIGLQDLLFNGAIACLLLFIIFAIKANGFAVISALSGDYSSLPIKSEAIDKSRKVLIEGVDGFTIPFKRTVLAVECEQW